MDKKIEQKYYRRLGRLEGILEIAEIVKKNMDNRFYKFIINLMDETKIEMQALKNSPSGREIELGGN